MVNIEVDNKNLSVRGIDFTIFVNPMHLGKPFDFLLIKN